MHRREHALSKIRAYHHPVSALCESCVAASSSRAYGTQAMQLETQDITTAPFAVCCTSKLSQELLTNTQASFALQDLIVLMQCKEKCPPRELTLAYCGQDYCSVATGPYVCDNPERARTALIHAVDGMNI